MRSRRIIHTLVVAALVLFMGAFILQHTGVLAQSGDRDPPRHKQLVAHTSREITLSGGVAPLRARSGHVAAAVPSGPIPALAMPELGRVLFVPTFSSRTVLVTNDYAYFNPDSPRAVHSADWIVTSGSLFARDRAGWTGAPDSVRPNANSSNGTDSATFRAVTRRRDFGNVAVGTTSASADVVVGAAEGPRNTTMASPKVRLMGDVAVVTYVRLVQYLDDSSGAVTSHYEETRIWQRQDGRWQHVLATIRSNANHTVTISAYVNGRLRLSTTDTGAGGSVLSEPGAVGLRGDNAEFEFSHFRVSELR